MDPHMVSGGASPARWNGGLDLNCSLPFEEAARLLVGLTATTSLNLQSLYKHR